MSFLCEQKKGSLLIPLLKQRLKYYVRLTVQPFFIIQKMTCLPFFFLLSLCFKLKSISGVAAVTSKFIQQDSCIILLLYTKTGGNKTYLSFFRELRQLLYNETQSKAFYGICLTTFKLTFLHLHFQINYGLQMNACNSWQRFIRWLHSNHGRQ